MLALYFHTVSMSGSPAQKTNPAMMAESSIVIVQVTQKGTLQMPGDLHG